MSVASGDSLTHLGPEIDQLISSQGIETAQELFAALTLIDENGALRRTLTDPTSTPEARQELAQRIFGSHLATNALPILKMLVSNRWSQERGLGDAVEEVAAQAAAKNAEGEGLQGLQQLTQQLLDFNHVVDSSHDVQRALTDSQAPAQKRGDLAVKLLGSGARSEAQLLVRQAVEHPRGAKPADVVRSFADSSAKLERRWIADVTVAKPLQQSQQERLQQGLSKAFGRDLALNVEVDPQLVGGIRVQVGDEVVDSSISSRLNDLKTKLAG